MKTFPQKIAMLCTVILLIASNSSFAKDVLVKIFTTDNPTAIGQVILRDSGDGLLIIPTLTKLPPGVHGFHVHENPDCSKLGMAAGSHFDPKDTNSHQGPEGHGHLGDLPVLIVDDAGNANAALIVPRLKTSMLKNRSLVIHSGSDNYSDNPPLGGGGSRFACGIIH